MNERTISLSRIKPNSWNPNEMSDTAFQEYVQEVKHLGKPPKPIVLRRRDDGYEIVDGEHSYRALKELKYQELQEGWFEIVEYDDVEAKRQTYKRNLSGKNNPVKLGIMFATALEESGMSNRQLAEKMDISEATIRAYLGYAESSKLRGDHSNIARLTNDQIKHFLKLVEISPPIAHFWLYCGALEEALVWNTNESFKKVKEQRSEFFIYLKNSLKDILEQGFDKNLTYKTDTIPLNLSQEEKATHILKFKNGIQKIYKLAILKKRMKASYIFEEGTSAELIDEYFDTYFNNPFFISNKDQYKVNKLLGIVIKRVDNKFKFLLTSKELKECIESTDDKNLLTITQKAKLSLVEKYKIAPSDISDTYKGSPEQELDRIEIEMKAPEYVKQAKWPISYKLKLAFMEMQFESEEIRKVRWEQIVRRFFKKEFRHIDSTDKEQYALKIREILREEEKKEKVGTENAAWMRMSEQELAKQFIEKTKSFTNEKDIDSKLIEKLVTTLPRNYLILLVFLSSKYYEEQEAKERLKKLVGGFANVFKKANYETKNK